jgi:hypothetical protein
MRTVTSDRRESPMLRGLTTVNFFAGLGIEPYFAAGGVT